MKKHWGSSIVEWEKLADPEVDRALTLEELSGGKTPPDNKRFRCTHCLHLPHEPERMDLMTLFQHLCTE